MSIQLHLFTGPASAFAEGSIGRLAVNGRGVGGRIWQARLIDRGIPSPQIAGALS
jgi:hypothetical protein